MCVVREKKGERERRDLQVFVFLLKKIVPDLWQMREFSEWLLANQTGSCSVAQ